MKDCKKHKDLPGYELIKSGFSKTHISYQLYKCSICQKEKSKEHYLKNKEKYSENRKKYRQLKKQGMETKRKTKVLRKNIICNLHGELDGSKTIFIKNKQNKYYGKCKACYNELLRVPKEYRSELNRWIKIKNPYAVYRAKIIIDKFEKENNYFSWLKLKIHEKQINYYRSYNTYTYKYRKEISQILKEFNFCLSFEEIPHEIIMLKKLMNNIKKKCKIACQSYDKRQKKLYKGISKAI